MNRRIPQLLLPIFIAIAAYLIWQHQSRIFHDQGKLTVTQEGQYVVLSWQGEIGVPMQRQIRQSIKEWKGTTDAFLFDLNSQGGSLREGSKVIELIDDLKATHVVNTRVGNRAICLSMCVPIFLQGKERLAAADSAWMFHEPIIVNFYTDEEADVPEFERRALAERFFNQYFDNSPMNEAWRDKLRIEWVGTEVWKTGSELIDEGSGIITQQL